MATNLEPDSAEPQFLHEADQRHVVRETAQLLRDRSAARKAVLGYRILPRLDAQKRHRRGRSRKPAGRAWTSAELVSDHEAGRKLRVRELAHPARQVGRAAAIQPVDRNGEGANRAEPERRRQQRRERGPRRAAPTVRGGWHTYADRRLALRFARSSVNASPVVFTIKDLPMQASASVPSILRS